MSSMTFHARSFEHLSSFSINLIPTLIIFAIAAYVFPILTRQLLRHLASPASFKEKTFSNGSPSVSNLPRLSGVVPWLGHLMGLTIDSSRYINRLIASTTAPIFTINIPFARITVCHPSMDRVLSRHVNDTGLAQVLVYVGPRLFGLREDTVKAVFAYNPQPLHKQKFGHADNIVSLNQRSSTNIRERVAKMPDSSELLIGRWVFELTVSATASAAWGVKNPWSMDQEFSNEFMKLSETFDTLGRPFSRLTANSAWNSRKFLLKRLREFHLQHREARIQATAHSINVVAHSDPNWETNADYYHIEMVSALGLLATTSTLAVWLIRHLLTDPELVQVVLKEVQQVKNVEGEDLPRLDFANVRSECPWLMAAWYETLRLHMTGVARIARHDFMLNMPGSDPIAVPQGEIFMLPMCASNLDVDNWGPDAAVFKASRFINKSGEVCGSAVRKVRAFGVAGNMCPGRVFGTDIIFSVIGTMLRTFHIEAAPGEEFRVPTLRGGFNVGFERYGDDVKVLLKRKHTA
ncbi:cholesterol 7-alpha-monooxygenase [Fusarium longipes]|uniref:Cholesterol 7-alpha-monooxygenase n=1 Tax=Fusarium longipes TaxID=694270 RepID=A0A395S8Q6_9HYPO|nr:cholesterol 7-alpha-monooxygenase [Fusarium longipes]